MKKLCAVLVSLCMLATLLPMTVAAEETASKIQPTLQEKMNNSVEGDLISTYVWFEPLSSDAIGRAESEIRNEAQNAILEKRAISVDAIREILEKEGFSEYTDAIFERIEQKIKEIDETEPDEKKAENKKMNCYSSIAYSYLFFSVLEPLSAHLAEEWGIDEDRVLIYGSPFSVMAMNLTPAEIETIAQSELSTKLDWYSGDIFDFHAHAHDCVAELSCLCIAPGTPGSYPGINCRHLVTSYGDTFLWYGDQERMADFENDITTLPDCFDTYTTNVFSNGNALFLDGVPNLGDYLMFFEQRRIKNVYIPNSVKEIGEHTFSQFADVCIHCYSGSYAEEYAKTHNYACHLLDTDEVIPAAMSGDANGDNARNLKDVLALRKALAEDTVSTLSAGADCNVDKSVDMKDVLLLRQHLADMLV